MGEVMSDADLQASSVLTPKDWYSVPEGLKFQAYDATPIAIVSPVPQEGTPTGVSVVLEKCAATCRVKLPTAFIGTVEIVDATGTLLYRLTSNELQIIASARNTRPITIKEE